jgi:hypothetical protein
MESIRVPCGITGIFMKSILDEHPSAGSVTKRTKEDVPLEPAPLVHFQSIQDYERLYKPEELARAVFTAEDESVLIRRPRWWTKDGERIPNSRSGMDLEQLCQTYKWKVVAQFGNHFAVVAPEERGE